MFFDEHPEFLETSRTASSRDRLNLRHLAIITDNRDVLQDRTVIDIASHDGRWSYAALDAGAARVIGIEGRRSLVRKTRQTFRAKEVAQERYRFIRGDVHTRLLEEDVEGDVVLCLGFLYHTARYVELMAGIRSTGAEYVIVDTRVLQGVEGPLVEMRTEGTKKESVAIKDRYARGRRVISAVPSEEAVVLMLDAAGYDVDKRTDWEELIGNHPGAAAVGQYARGQRVTFRAKRRPTRRELAAAAAEAGSPDSAGSPGDE